MSRKIHNQEAGYVAERRNDFASGKVVIYIAAEQGIDTGGKKYAVVCDAHGAIGGTSNIPDARVLMKDPYNFCEACQESMDHPGTPADPEEVAATLARWNVRKEPQS